MQDSEVTCELFQAYQSCHKRSWGTFILKTVFVAKQPMMVFRIKLLPVRLTLNAYIIRISNFH